MVSEQEAEKRLLRVCELVAAASRGTGKIDIAVIARLHELSGIAMGEGK